MSAVEPTPAWLVERQPLLEVVDGFRRPAHRHRRRPHRVIGFKEECRVFSDLGQGEDLLGQLARPRVLAATMVEIPQPPQHGKEPRAVLELRAQFRS